MTPAEIIAREPNPGTDDAVALGCRCPVIDNGRGRGYMGGAKDENGGTLFVIVADCPLHAPLALEAKG